DYLKLKKKSIINAVTESLGSSEFELRLYGSRVDDHKKGGDIDLLLISKDTESRKIFEKLKPKILAKIDFYLEEQEKIDLTITARDDIKKDPFLSLIIEKSILLADKF
ncbi:MAG: nucleotidyltransferase domain-containing protein, partial [Gammaproteobacteria bacterium]